MTTETSLPQRLSMSSATKSTCGQQSGYFLYAKHYNFEDKI